MKHGFLELFKIVWRKTPVGLDFNSPAKKEENAGWVLRPFTGPSGSVIINQSTKVTNPFCQMFS